MPRRPSAPTHHAAMPRRRASSPIARRPARNSAFAQTSAQAGSAPATVTASSPVLRGRARHRVDQVVDRSPIGRHPATDADGRRRDGAAADGDHGDRRFVAFARNRVLDSDLPGLPGARRDDVATRVEQDPRTRRQARQCPPGRPAQREALADAARVEGALRDADGTRPLQWDTGCGREPMPTRARWSPRARRSPPAPPAPRGRTGPPSRDTPDASPPPLRAAATRRLPPHPTRLGG